MHMARSGVGAEGLMQVMPATARWIAGKMNVKDYSIMDVDTNIQFGTVPQLRQPVAGTPGAGDSRLQRRPLRTRGHGGQRYRWKVPSTPKPSRLTRHATMSKK